MCAAGEQITAAIVEGVINPMGTPEQQEERRLHSETQDRFDAEAAALGLWRTRWSQQPPPHVLRVRDEHDGYEMVRTAVPCGYCGDDDALWVWLHNGAMDCWLDMDGYGPFIEVKPADGDYRGPLSRVEAAYLARIQPPKPRRRGWWERLTTFGA